MFEIVKGKYLVPTIYFVASAMYIIISDLILLALIEDLNLYREIQTFKGWLFILLSSVLLYFLINNLTKEISIEHQKEEELKKKLDINHQSFEKLFKYNPIPMWIYDLNTLSFLDVNQAAINLYGYSLEEFLLLTIKDIRPPNDIDRLLDDIKTNSGVISKANKWRHIKKNGELIYVEIKSHSFEYQGKEARNVMVYDVTEVTKLNNELLIEKEKANESSKLKSAILQNISHEIRTPLNGIIGLSKLVLSDNIDAEDKQEFSDLIQLSSHRLIMTIDNLIELSKVESGSIKLKLELSNVNHIIDALYDMYDYQCRQANIELSFKKCKNDDLCIVNIDRKKILQIFDILLNNAVKFAQQGSITFGYELEANYLLGFVIDTGIGISEFNQPKIFDSFFQVEDTISRNYEGSGVGLTICKALVTLMNGNIWLESKLGEGSKFYFRIPITTPM
ncbi:MAG TPA: PAS domain-containing sensor histidine kinase [Candidatus Kapabacteria bacterium]|nr:PAS domain-containing sensor histidine kinase [Candidatus Kapabacteria bacterium]